MFNQISARESQVKANVISFLYFEKFRLSTFVWVGVGVIFPSQLDGGTNS